MEKIGHVTKVTETAAGLSIEAVIPEYVFRRVSYGRIIEEMELGHIGPWVIMMKTVGGQHYVWSRPHRYTNVKWRLPSIAGDDMLRFIDDMVEAFPNPRELITLEGGWEKVAHVVFWSHIDRPNPWVDMPAYPKVRRDPPKRVKRPWVVMQLLRNGNRYYGTKEREATFDSSKAAYYTQKTRANFKPIELLPTPISLCALDIVTLWHRVGDPLPEHPRAMSGVYDKYSNGGIKPYGDHKTR